MPPRTRKITPCIAAVAVAALFGLFPVMGHADDWQEQGPGHWINYDSAWVDTTTGVVVIEVADDAGNNKLAYGLIAIDCKNWRVHKLTPETAERRYAIYGSWRTSNNLSAAIQPNSLAGDTANRLCPGRGNLPSDTLP